MLSIPVFFVMFVSMTVDAFPPSGLLIIRASQVRGSSCTEYVRCRSEEASYGNSTNETVQCRHNVVADILIGDLITRRFTFNWTKEESGASVGAASVKRQFLMTGKEEDEGDVAGLFRSSIIILLISGTFFVTVDIATIPRHDRYNMVQPGSTFPQTSLNIPPFTQASLVFVDNLPLS